MRKKLHGKMSRGKIWSYKLAATLGSNEEGVRQGGRKKEEELGKSGSNIPNGNQVFCLHSPSPEPAGTREE